MVLDLLGSACRDVKSDPQATVRRLGAWLKQQDWVWTRPTELTNNGDLWAVLFKLLEQQGRKSRLQAEWVPAHTSAAAVASGKISLEDQCGNRFVDDHAKSATAGFPQLTKYLCNVYSERDRAWGRVVPIFQKALVAIRACMAATIGRMERNLYTKPPTGEEEEEEYDERDVDMKAPPVQWLVSWSPSTESNAVSIFHEGFALAPPVDDWLHAAVAAFWETAECVPIPEEDRDIVGVSTWLEVIMLFEHRFECKVPPRGQDCNARKWCRRRLPKEGNVRAIISRFKAVTGTVLGTTVEGKALAEKT